MDGFLLLLKKHNLQFKKVAHKVLLKNLQDFFIVLTPLVLIIIIVIIVLINEQTTELIQKNKLLEVTSVSISSPALYPRMRIKKINNDSLLSNLSAKAFVAVDNDSKVIITSYNETSSFSMASTTKIMTALVSLDHYKMDDVITVRNISSISGVIVGFPQNETIYFKDMLYALLLPSGNDAAMALAYNYPGGEEKFVEHMNKKAKELFLLNTYFKEPTGLSEENTTTPVDLARLSSVALQNKTFSYIVSTKQKTISNLDNTKIYSLTNLNKLLGIDGVNGVKTGFTDEAGEVLVTSQVKDGHTTLFVVMKSENRFFDTQQLLLLLRRNVEYFTFHPFTTQPTRF